MIFPQSLKSLIFICLQMIPIFKYFKDAENLEKIEKLLTQN